MPLTITINEAAPGTLTIGVGPPGAGVPTGGGTGTVLKKLSGADYDTGWASDISGVAWGAITGTLSTQTDLQTALNLKLDSSTAASTYYLQTNPAQYQTVGDLSGALAPYLLSATAATTYYPLVGNPSGFLTSAPVTSVAGMTGAVVLANTDISGLGTMSTATAADYSTTIAADALYYPLSGNPSGFLTSAPVTSVAGMTGAVLLANTDISGLGTMSTATAADYSTTVQADGLYYPLSGNPSGFLTSAPVTSVAGMTGAVTLSNTDISGLGTMAVETATNYLTTATAASTYQTISGMSSYLTSATAASTYFTIANAANKADLASPTFTGTPTLPTGTIATTQTPGNNTTAVATTAFVTAAVPAFATTAEIASPSSTNKVVAPNDVVRMIVNRATFDTQNSSPTFATSGVGATAYKATNDRLLEIGSPNVLTAGYGQMIYDTTAGSWGALGAKRGDNFFTQDFSKKIWMSGTHCFTLLGDADTVAYCMMGGRNTVTTGQPTLQGFGWKLVGGSTALTLITYGYDGASLVITETASSFIPVSNQSFDWMIVNEGSGAGGASSTCKLYVNDTLVASGINSPGGSLVNYNYLFNSFESTITATTRMSSLVFPIKLWWSKS